MPDLVSLLAAMDETQRRVFDDAMATESDLAEWQRSIRDSNRRVTATAIHHLLGQHGSGSVPVVLGDDLGAAIEAAAQASSESILATYNTALARAILAIGDQVTDPDYVTYRSWLFGDSAYAVAPGLLNWASRRGPAKVQEISLAETATTINLAVDLFYEHNPDLDGLAELRPYSAACAFCQQGLDGNPYSSIRDALDTGERIGMFHVRCIHYAELVSPRMAADSGQVWAGS